MARHAKSSTVSSKLFTSAALVAGAAGVAGLGTFGSFTSTTSADQALASGTVVIGLGAPGTAANRLTVGASGLVPGDSVQRAVDLTNTGSEALAGVTLTTTAAPSSLLHTDPAGGLQLTVDRCSVPWTEGGAAPAYTYTCAGTVTSLVGSRPVLATDVPLDGLAALATGGSDHLRVTLALPASAGNALQGQSSTLTFSFTGLQRAGSAK